MQGRLPLRGCPKCQIAVTSLRKALPPIGSRLSREAFLTG
jgi:hypothetical protein